MQKARGNSSLFRFFFFLFPLDQKSKPLILESEAKNVIFAGRENSTDFIWAFILE